MNSRHEEVEDLLSIRDLSVSFDLVGGTVVAVRGIDITMRRGECLAIVGESGSGKSVTARAIVGLAGDAARVRAAELTFDGSDLMRYQSPQWRQLRGARIGLVLQDALTSLDPLRRVGDEVSEPFVVHGMLKRRHDRAKRVVELLGDVGVPDPELRARQFPHELSGGLRQRALIASAIAAQPSLIIADEPTTALDVTVQAQVLDLLAALRDSGVAVLLISHDLTVVARMADRIAVMKAGRIVETDPAAKILTSPEHPYTRRLLAAAPILGTSGASHRRNRFASNGSVATPADESRRAVLEVDAIAKRFRSPDGGWRQAVDGVSFTVCAGEALGVVGESGSGKTTTAQIVLAMLAADHGEVRLYGEPWSRLTEHRRRARRQRIQLVPQDPLGSFDPRFTVERIIAESLGRPGRRGAKANRSRVIELLHHVGLDERILGRRGIHLSGGQRQRVAIARALGPRPDILVCDEPVSALDVSIQAQILELLATLRRDVGVALLFISHDLGVINEVCDRTLVMKDGAVVEHGDVANVLFAPQHPYTKALLAAATSSTHQPRGQKSRGKPSQPKEDRHDRDAGQPDPEVDIGGHEHAREHRRDGATHPSRPRC